MLHSIVFATEAGTESTVTASDTVSWFNTAIETIQNLSFGVFFIVAVVLIILSIVNIRRRSVLFTERQISSLKTNGKYIPGIFVELNESKEIMRYFLFGKKWKPRIIRRFNYIWVQLFL